MRYPEDIETIQNYERIKDLTIEEIVEMLATLVTCNQKSETSSNDSDGLSKTEQTNGDYIRSMTDEELAKLLRTTVQRNGEDLFVCKEDYYDYCRGYMCKDCPNYLRWIKSKKGEFSFNLNVDDMR